MNPEVLNWVVAALVVVVLALVVGIVVISNKAVNTSGEQYPAGTLDKLESVLKIGWAGARLTPASFDDEGVKLLARTVGFDVSVGEDGALILKRPPPAVPAAK